MYRCRILRCVASRTTKARPSFFTEMLSGFDPWDRMMWITVLEHYPLGFFWHNMSCAAMTYAVFQAHYRFGWAEYYKKHWLDLRAIPDSETLIIGTISFVITYVLLNQYIALTVIVLYRLTRRLSGRPMGPP